MHMWDEDGSFKKAYAGHKGAVRAIEVVGTALAQSTRCADICFNRDSIKLESSFASFRRSVPLRFLFQVPLD